MTDLQTEMTFMWKQIEQSPREFLKLLSLKAYVGIKNGIENAKVIAKYWRVPKFMCADFGLFLIYLFDNPFKVSKRFLIGKGEENLYQYGETPLTTLEQIMNRVGVTANDTVFELGSGRGRCCFWLSQYLGCSVVGIEQVPSFVERANRIIKRCGLQKVAFKCADFNEVSLKGATVVYLYGTCLEPGAIHKLINKLKELPSGTKIITVSYPLTDYDNTDTFELMNCFSQSFTWGIAEVYFHIVK